MKALVTRVLDVRKHPNADRLTIVTVRGEQIDVPPGAAQVPFQAYEVVANLDDDGNPRWTPGEWVIYVPEGAVVPEDVLKERGYWDEEKDRGYLGGPAHNVVEARKMRGVDSRGLLFKVREDSNSYADSCSYFVERGGKDIRVSGLEETEHEMVTTFLGLTERAPG
jgi:tRNA-binding EMAP/Myf-like protein